MIAPIVDSVAAHSRVSIPCDLHPGSLLEQARGREEEFATGAFEIVYRNTLYFRTQESS